MPRRRRRRTSPLALGLAIAAVAIVGLAFVLRAMAGGAPAFTVEHAAVIEATPERAWAVLSDFDAYPQWNPHVIRVSGKVAAQRDVAVTLAQRDWKQPRTVTRRVVRFEEPREIHWHGSLWLPGLYETHHSLRVVPEAPGRVRFVQRESFGGLFARLVRDVSRPHTREAFRASSDALARRIAWLGANPIEPEGGLDAIDGLDAVGFDRLVFP